MNPGAHPVLKERLGTSKLKSSMYEFSSSSSSFDPSSRSSPGLSAGFVNFRRLFEPEDDECETLHEAISSVCRISAFTPHTAVVSPSRTTALPFVCVSEPVFADVTRNCEGARPLARIEGCWLDVGGER